MFASVQNLINLGCFTRAMLTDISGKYAARGVVYINVILKFYRAKNIKVIHERKNVSKSNLNILTRGKSLTQ